MSKNSVLEKIIFRCVISTNYADHICYYWGEVKTSPCSICKSIYKNNSTILFSVRRMKSQYIKNIVY